MKKEKKSYFFMEIYLSTGGEISTDASLLAQNVSFGLISG